MNGAAAPLAAQLQQLREKALAELNKSGPRPAAKLALDLQAPEPSLLLALGMLFQEGKVRLTGEELAVECAAAHQPSSRHSVEQAMGEALSAFNSAEPTGESPAGAIPDPLSLAEAEASADPK